MKFKLLLIAIMLPSICMCQTRSIDTLTNQVKYEKVFIIKGSKDELYGKLKTWIANSFNNYKSVVEHTDKETGQIFIKGNFKVFSAIKMNNRPDSIFSNVNFEGRLYAKDDRCKFIVTNLKSREITISKENIANKGDVGYFTQSILQKSGEIIDAMFIDIEKYMNSKSESQF
jgi:hypothetical protein